MTKKSLARQQRDNAEELAGNNSWDDLTVLWSQTTQYFSTAASLHVQLSDKNLTKYLDALNFERFNRTVQALTSDLKTMYEELRAIHDTHKDRKGPVAVSDIMEFFVCFENYDAFNNRVDSIIRPSVEFIAAELDKAANAMVRAGDPNVKVIDPVTGKEVPLPDAEQETPVESQTTEATEQ